MGRVKNHGAKAAAASNKHRRGRGRPPVDWTESRKRKLLRLYLGTPASILSLKDIRDLLSQDGFQPAERKTQEVLQALLSNGYNKRRPANKSAMLRRLEFFKSLRACRDSGKMLCDAEGLCPPKGLDLSLHSRIGPEQATHSEAVELPVPDEICLPFYYPDGYGDLLNESQSQPIDIHPGRRFSFDHSKEPEYLTTTSTTTTPQSTRPHQSITGSQKRVERINFLRGKLASSRSSSVLERIASLLSSNLSFRSNNSKSARQPLRRSNGTASSRPSTKTRISFRTRDLPAELPAELTTNEVKDVTVVKDLPSRNDKALSISSLYTIEYEEIAVLEACCSRAECFPCVHQRLKQAIRLSDFDSKANISVSPDETARADVLGNTLLHVATRWHASLELLHSIIQQGANPNTTNNARETFLHLLYPWTDPNLTPITISNLMALLANRQFNFCLRDSTGKTFLQRWVSSPAMTLSLLEPFLATIPSYAKQHLQSDQTTSGRQLYTWIQNKLPEALAEANLPDAVNCSNVPRYIRTITLRYTQASIIQPNTNTIIYTGLPPLRGGWNHLHQLIAGAHRHNALFPGPSAPAVTAAHYLSYLDSVLSHSNPLDVNNTELLTRRTPLMTLLNSCGHLSSPSDGGFLSQVVHKLLRAGASLHARDAAGNTPLHYAALRQVPEVVLALCQAGVEVNDETAEGLTALEVVRRCIQREIERTGRGEEQDVRSLAGWLECGTILIDFGGRGSGGEDWKQFFDWGRYFSNVAPGTPLLQTGLTLAYT